MSAKSLLTDTSHMATPDVSETILPPSIEDLTESQGEGESVQF